MIQGKYLATSKKGFSHFAFQPEVLLRSFSLQEIFPSSAIHHSNFTGSLQLFSPWVGEAGTVIILSILYKVKKREKKDYLWITLQTTHKARKIEKKQLFSCSGQL